MPGARRVLTQGLALQPRFTRVAGDAGRQPPCTEGFDVLVQEVMAAITTSPWPRSKLVPAPARAFQPRDALPIFLVERLGESAPDRAGERHPVLRPLRAGERRLDRRAGRAASVSVNTGSGVSPSRNMPCALA